MPRGRADTIAGERLETTIWDLTQVIVLRHGQCSFMQAQMALLSAIGAYQRENDATVIRPKAKTRAEICDEAMRILTINRRWPDV